VSWITGLPRAIYEFFTEDGSVVVGAIVALVVVGTLARVHPFGSAQDLAGPLLFVLIAALLIANLWRVAERSKQ
jgi:hypothetical protein